MKKEFSNTNIITYVQTLVLIGLLSLFVTNVKGQITYPYKFTYNGNPLERNHGASDPSVHVWDGTVWVYCSQDHKSNTSNSYAAMDGYHAYSSTDMVNWTDYGDVFNSSMLNANSWGNTQKGWMWAPSASRKKDTNDVWTYYLYYPHNKAAVGAGEEWVTGVATAPNPWGPFTDQGILGGWPSWKAAMDPMVFIDDDGQAYIYANSAKVSKLNPDMISLAEAPKNIIYGPSEVSNDPAIRFGEGSYMHKKDGNYYFSFSNSNSEKYSAYYAMGKNPYGPFEWKGQLAPKHVGAQDHHSVIEFKGQWYYFYHIAPPNIPAVKDGQSRIVCYDKLFYNPDGTIKLIKDTQGPTFTLLTNTTNGYIKTDTPGPVYEAGTPVTVTGIGDLGYAFNSWSGDLTGTTNPAIIVMNSDKNISASFISVPIYSLTTSATNGTITLDPPGGVYSKGVIVTLTANNNLGYAFSNWSGDITGSANPATVTIDTNKNVIANFITAPTYKLNTQAENGTITLTPAGGIYNKYTVVEVKAKANAGYLFSYWSGDPLNDEFYINPNFITMDSGKSITANFSATSSLNAFSQIEAESYNDMSGVQKETCIEGGQNIGFIENGDFIIFYNVNFTTGAASFDARVASAGSGGSIEVRMDSISGTLVGTCAVSGTGGWQTWATKNCVISGASGTHNLYLKFTGGTGYLFNLNWVKFAKTLSIDQEKTVPYETMLMQNYPNPFNPETNISYQLSALSQTKITICNTLGQEVIKLVDRDQAAGHYSVRWNGRDRSGNKVASGIYFYMLEANSSMFTKKLILLQ